MHLYRSLPGSVRSKFWSYLLNIYGYAMHFSGTEFSRVHAGCRRDDDKGGPGARGGLPLMTACFVSRVSCPCLVGGVVVTCTGGPDAADDAPAPPCAVCAAAAGAGVTPAVLCARLPVCVCLTSCVSYVGMCLCDSVTACVTLFCRYCIVP